MNNKFLYNKMEHLSARNGMKLQMVVFQNLIDEVKNILKLHKNCINFQDFQGNTAFTVACSNKRLDIIKILLENGADASIGGSPIQLPYCYLNNNLTLLKFIIENGAIVNKVYVLNYAIYYCNIDMIKYLIDLGTDLNEIVELKSSLYRMCVILMEIKENYAIHYHCIQIIKLLINYGAKVNFYNQIENTGNITTEFTCLKNYKEIVNLILNNGLHIDNIDISNNRKLLMYYLLPYIYKNNSKNILKKIPTDLLYFLSEF